MERLPRGCKPGDYSARMAAPVLRPLSFGEVLDTSFNLFKRNFKTVTVISAVVMIPLALLGALATAGLAPTDLAPLDDPQASIEDVLGVLLPLYGALGAGLLLQFFGQVLVQAATTRVYAEAYHGGTIGIREGLRVGLRRLPAMLGLTIVSSIGMLVGFVLCIIPGVWVYVAWALSPAALITEDKGPFSALRRSMSLVKDSWWRTFGLLVVVNLLVGVIVSVVTFPIQIAGTFGAAAAADPSALFSGTFLAVNTFVSGLVNAFTLPFLAGVVVAIYFDQRVRKEGFDLDRLIADLGDEPERHDGQWSEPTDPFGLG